MYMLFCLIPIVAFGLTAFAANRWPLPRPYLMGIGVMIIGPLAAWAAWEFRDSGFDRLGANCQTGPTRGFMEQATWAIALVAALPAAGAGFVSGRLYRQSVAGSVAAGVVLLALAMLYWFGCVFAAGMTAVDSYGC